MVRGRFCVKRCGPSRHRLRDISAALENFARHPKKDFFNTIDPKLTLVWASGRSGIGHGSVYRSVFKYGIGSARSALSPERLLRDHWLDRRRWRRSRWRERKCHPGIPAVGPVFGGELPVALQIEVALHVADGKNETNLPAGGCHLRLEAADAIAGGAVARLWNSILVVS